MKAFIIGLCGTVLLGLSFIGVSNASFDKGQKEGYSDGLSSGKAIGAKAVYRNGKSEIYLDTGAGILRLLPLDDEATIVQEDESNIEIMGSWLMLPDNDAYADQNLEITKYVMKTDGTIVLKENSVLAYEADIKTSRNLMFSGLPRLDPIEVSNLGPTFNNMSEIELK